MIMQWVFRNLLSSSNYFRSQNYNSIMKIKSLFTYLFILLFFTNCGKDDDAGPFGNCDNASFAYTIDGSDLIINKVSATFNPNMNNTGVKVLDISITNDDGSRASIQISNFIFASGPITECIGVTQYFNDPLLNDCISNGPAAICNGTAMNYTSSANVAFTSFTTDEGFMTISNCDQSDKTISGNFDFTVENLTENTSHQLVGQFSNLCYEVQ